MPGAIDDKLLILIYEKKEIEELSNDILNKNVKISIPSSNNKNEKYRKLKEK